MTDAARRSAASKLPARIAFLGFGLIGGSLALALREAGSTTRLAAWTPDGTGPAEGVRRRLLDVAPATAAEALDGAGLVVLAGPPLAILSALEELAGTLNGALSAGVTITDVASTKAVIAATAEDLGLPFVGGHPMAGRETTGVGSATADLFLDRPWVIVVAEGTDARHVERVEALATAAGARPARMEAIDHDLAVAAISHLPLIASAALVESVAADAERWPVARRLAASGWRDVTRLARGDPDMGAGIIATNARPIAGYLRAYRDALDAWLAELDEMTDESQPVVPGPERVAGLKTRLVAARATLEQEPGA
ncbi:MAG TPA: prephenate dehydrogenase/arogenate dehydrogenase family protein [Candidatus Limnocylindria bacterium]|nr:prephenate dehydrogenase/arogenate dehydrogenase family protein [Candidatus Limnocylindria bacterium]